MNVTGHLVLGRDGEAVSGYLRIGHIPQPARADHPLPKDIQRLLIDLAATDVPLAPGWASVVSRAEATIKAQAARIAELEASLSRLAEG